MPSARPIVKSVLQCGYTANRMMNVKAVPDLEEIDRLVKQILYFFCQRKIFSSIKMATPNLYINGPKKEGSQLNTELPAFLENQNP